MFERASAGAGGDGGCIGAGPLSDCLNSAFFSWGFGGGGVVGVGGGGLLT